MHLCMCVEHVILKNDLTHFFLKGIDPVYHTVYYKVPYNRGRKNSNPGNFGKKFLIPALDFSTAIHQLKKYAILAACCDHF